MSYSRDFKTHANDIEGLFQKTFSDSEGIEEGALIGDLVTRLMTETPKADLRVFMRWEDDTLIGCICFSRLIYLSQPCKIFMMSPVAVSTEHQRKRIGQSLISYGLSELKLDGVDIAVTYGDPAFINTLALQLFLRIRFLRLTLYSNLRGGLLRLQMKRR